MTTADDTQITTRVSVSSECREMCRYGASLEPTTAAISGARSRACASRALA